MAALDDLLAEVLSIVEDAVPGADTTVTRFLLALPVGLTRPDPLDRAPC